MLHVAKHSHRKSVSLMQCTNDDKCTSISITAHFSVYHTQCTRIAITTWCQNKRAETFANQIVLIFLNNNYTLMIDSTKVLCPLCDEMEILIPGDSLSSGQNVKF